LSSFDEGRFLSLLKTRSLGRPFHYFPSTDSSSNQLKRLADQGAEEGTLVLADSQTAGRGRWGRSWESSPGKNLLFSFLLRPASGLRSQLSAVFGLACLEAIHLGRLKWPNDLWIKGKKICGILLEGSDEAVLVGIGINVNAGTEDFPVDLRSQASSLLLELGTPQDRECLLAETLMRCEALYGQWREEGFEALRARWNENALFMGENVRCGEKEGKLLGLDEDGALLIQSSQGLEKLVSGEVFGLRPVLD
jgi:BirA family biotin operon repressor/biotin-[acetyl-CoA-carboxylase] ligase